jgi:hypothetical protein
MYVAEWKRTWSLERLNDLPPIDCIFFEDNSPWLTADHGNDRWDRLLVDGPTYAALPGAGLPRLLLKVDHSVWEATTPDY